MEERVGTEHCLACSFIFTVLFITLNKALIIIGIILSVLKFSKRNYNLNDCLSYVVIDIDIISGFYDYFQVYDNIFVIKSIFFLFQILLN